MPKVRGPLMSVSASGTFRDMIQFRSGAAGTVVTGTRQVHPQRSPAQLAQAARFADAVTGWRAATVQAKADWASAASSRNLTGYQFYVSEYQAQALSPPAQPTIP